MALPEGIGHMFPVWLVTHLGQLFWNATSDILCQIGPLTHAIINFV